MLCIAHKGVTALKFVQSLEIWALYKTIQKCYFKILEALYKERINTNIKDNMDKTKQEILEY